MTPDRIAELRAISAKAQPGGGDDFLDVIAAAHGLPEALDEIARLVAELRQPTAFFLGKADSPIYDKTRIAAADLIERLRAEGVELRDRMEARDVANVAMFKAINAIIEMETPWANATVKRMANIAREALLQSEEGT